MKTWRSFRHKQLIIAFLHQVKVRYDNLASVVIDPWLNEQLSKKTLVMLIQTTQTFFVSAALPQPNHTNEDFRCCLQQSLTFFQLFFIYDSQFFWSI